ncbi:CPBP family intramembrane glutamic endopeptidase [Wolbachia endosymbiont of Folsomia candida]|uniref:CPBP family intramembrane glutamic endopeptidase n=1 Tax=Wolbachia endosymbiont of Folsomia candida TaxID=169402 RepID=UPI000ADC249B|nr:CPBP family intramembrane glutamic endopeptidase [Wolbachia endosymbiont of Folsomia candida]APR98263.2 CPBP family intramembrane metalloprotease [Wolbachia endosymbiont of Folsomia candida]
MNSTTINCILFVIITYVLTCIVAWSGNQYVISIATFIPATVAMGLTIYNKEKIRDLFKRSSLRNCFLGFIIPIVTLYLINSIIVLLIYYLLELPWEVEYTLEKIKDFSAVMLLFILLSNFVMLIITSLGEEIGWRSYLLKKLKTKIPNFYARAIVIGFIWGLWHMPLWQAVGPMLWKDGLTLSVAFVFMASACSASLLFTWLFEKDNSIWPVTILHATTNYICQTIPMLFTTMTLPVPNYMTVYGLVSLAISYLIVGVGVIWFDKVRGHRLSDS